MDSLTNCEDILTLFRYFKDLLEVVVFPCKSYRFPCKLRGTPLNIPHPHAKVKGGGWSACAVLTGHRTLRDQALWCSWEFLGPLIASWVLTVARGITRGSDNGVVRGQVAPGRGIATLDLRWSADCYCKGTGGMGGGGRQGVGVVRSGYVRVVFGLRSGCVRVACELRSHRVACVSGDGPGNLWFQVRGRAELGRHK